MNVLQIESRDALFKLLFILFTTAEDNAAIHQAAGIELKSEFKIFSIYVPTLE